MDNDRGYARGFVEGFGYGFWSILMIFIAALAGSALGVSVF